MNQTDAPVAANLRRFLDRPVAGFGGPGHHLGQGAPDQAIEALGREAFRADILTPKGLDDRTKRYAVMEDAERLAAAAWGADHGFYGTSGTTQNLQALILSVAAPGDTILVAANDHRASFSLAITSGIRVVPTAAAYDAERDVENGVTPEAVAASLSAHPGAKAIVIVSPTFFGVTADVAAIAACVHRAGLPLIVDAAWGGAFAFSTRLPACPLSLGADAMVTSVHKTMGALAQGSAILLKGSRIDADRVQALLECLQTTSPSVPILASLDLARRDHATNGEAIWRDVLDRTARAADRIAAIPGLVVYGDERIGGPGAADVDRSKLTIDVSELGISGFDADEWLQREHRVSIVLSDLRHLVATFAIGTSDDDVDRLVDGLAGLSAAVGRGAIRRTERRPGYGDLTPELADAAAGGRGETRRLRYADAIGMVAAEVVAPTPPEIPRLMPGWIVTPAIAEWLTAVEEAGGYIPDPCGERKGQVLVKTQHL